ncbi:MAG: hypothetical protein PHN42_05850 [Bacilli bacterium]|nr:hypothetical protein [Bacilli bacterium]
MEQVPDVISNKDLTYLCDIFNWNFNTLKLVNHFKDEVKLEELKDVFDDITEIHNNICNGIINILERRTNE